MSKTKKEKKIFVLDTSVIIYEHNSILNFDEHDIGIPITVLEELDNFKKGNDTKNFEAREFIRLIDKLANGQMLHHWNPLNGKSKGTFKVLMDTGGNGSLDANKLATSLYQKDRVAITTRGGQDRPGIRVSPHLYNSPAEVDRLLAGLARHLKSGV